MVKTDSAKEFADRFRREQIIPLSGINSREKLEIALKRANLTGSTQRLLAYEVLKFDEKPLEYRQPKRVERSHKKYYTYKGRPSRSVGRNTREEILTDSKGNEMKRYRDYKTGKFTFNPNQYRIRHIKRYGNRYKVYIDPQTGRIKKFIGKIN